MRNQHKQVVRMKVLLSLMLILLLFILSGCSQTNQDKDLTGVMWRIEKNGTTMYLLGSIHFTKDTMYPLNDKIIEAFSSSDETYYEIDFNKKISNEEWLEINENAMLDQSYSINELLSIEDYNLLDESFKGVGIDITSLHKYKPMYLFMLYSSQLLTQNFSSDLPVDVFLYNTAVEENKGINELEGIRLQYDILYNLSLDLQIELLMDSLNSEEFIEQANKQLDDWSKGDFDQLESDFGKFKIDNEILDKEYKEKMLYKRNENIVAKLVEILDSNDEKTHFVTIGIGHMMGDKNVIELLKELGYQVNQF
jgi:uncharacterized protein YbaP (TraB family)